MINSDIKERILDFISSSSIGSTISAISRELGISRPTVYKYLGELKAEGLVKEISVGAYKLYLPSERLQAEVRMISKKLLCALVCAFNKTFVTNSSNLSFQLGMQLVDSFLSMYREDIEKLDMLPGTSVFDKIKLILNLFLGHEIQIDVIELEENRVILRLAGEMCEEESTRILIEFLKGAISRFIGLATKRKIVFGSENIKKVEENIFDVAIEITLP